MKRGRLPLTALRSFEVAGRHGNVTRAAEELLVSQAAVSRQIRDLETMLGHPLFERRPRGLVLTPDGARLLAVLTDAFDAIGGTLEAIAAGPAEAAVTLSVEPSFAAGWLVPHLAAFRDAEPAIEVTIDADPHLIDFRTRPGHLAIRYSATASTWPRVESRRLADVAVIAVAAPELLSAHPPVRTVADLAGLPLLHEENRDAWQRWFAAAGLAEAPVPRGPVLADGGLVLQAALRGQGAALLDGLFAGEALARGQLVQLFDIALPFGAYFLVARRFSALPPPAAAFAHWLTQTLARA